MFEEYPFTIVEPIREATRLSFRENCMFDEHPFTLEGDLRLHDSLRLNGISRANR
jgi:hypothetical protein